MIGRVGQRRARREDGFSLVELLVIVVIIGVLAAIAISTYINQTKKAERAAAISTLSNMRLAAESIRANEDAQEFSGETDAYEAEQASYEYTTGASEGTSEVSVAAGAEGDWVAFAVKGKGQCFYLRLQAGEDTLYQHTADLTGSETCDALDFSSGVGTGAWT